MKDKKIILLTASCRITNEDHLIIEKWLKDNNFNNISQAFKNVLQDVCNCKTFPEENKKSLQQELSMLEESDVIALKAWLSSKNMTLTSIAKKARELIKN